MADTIFQAGMEGFKTAAEMPAEMGLLSTRAQAAKLQLEEEKQALQTRMATRAAMSKAQIANSNQDLGTIQGNIKLMDYAIGQTNDPEVKQNLFKQKQSMLSQQASLAIEQGKAREDHRAAIYEESAQYLAMGPEGGDNLIKLGQTEGNPALVAFGLQMQDKAPIPLLGNKKYSQLSPEEKTVWRNTVSRGLEPKAGESAIRNAMREQYESAVIAERQRSDDNKHQDAQQRIANQRERTSIEKTKTEAKASTAIPIQLSKLEVSKTNDINKLRKQQSDLLIKAGMPREGVTTEGWFSSHHKDLPKEIQDAYEGYNVAIKAREQAHEAAREALGRPSAKVGDKTYQRPAGWDDAKWEAYKKAVGAK